MNNTVTVAELLNPLKPCSGVITPVTNKLATIMSATKSIAISSVMNSTRAQQIIIKTIMALVVIYKLI
jgi:hypothetical protein